MATSYLNGKRATNKYQARFKSSTSNLTASTNQLNGARANQRLKSTSMTNLLASEQAAKNSQEHTNKQSSIQRPISRNALDSIHNGMNAKYAQIQSKVLLQNIRPQGAGSVAASNNLNSNNNLTKLTSNRSATLQSSSNTIRSSNIRSTTPTKSIQSDRTQLLSKLKTLQEEVEKSLEERESLKLELDREKGEKNETVQQLKQELQDKLMEHDKQHEEYHQKLLEAYELADQNRRAADQVLSESRLRDEELRKRNEELEAQLGELKEFVSMKEEMTGKMYELREQIREERERYEEQLKSLHQVFENEKLR